MSIEQLNTGAALRLELVKVCHRPDKSAEEIAAHACKLENYVLGYEQLVDSTSIKTTEKKPRTEKAKAPV